VDRIYFLSVATLAVPVPVQIVITPNSGTPGSFDFSWNSNAGKVYDLVSSTDLSTAPDTWPVWQGHSGIPTNHPAANTLTNIPGGGDPKRFFSVIEKQAP
jgi:hypothetical protein